MSGETTPKPALSPWFMCNFNNLSVSVDLIISHFFDPNNAVFREELKKQIDHAVRRQSARFMSVMTPDSPYLDGKTLDDMADYLSTLRGMLVEIDRVLAKQPRAIEFLLSSLVHPVVNNIFGPGSIEGLSYTDDNALSHQKYVRSSFDYAKWFYSLGRPDETGISGNFKRDKTSTSDAGDLSQLVFYFVNSTEEYAEDFFSEDENVSEDEKQRRIKDFCPMYRRVFEEILVDPSLALTLLHISSIALRSGVDATLNNIKRPTGRPPRHDLHRFVSDLAVIWRVSRDSEPTTSFKDTEFGYFCQVCLWAAMPSTKHEAELSTKLKNAVSFEVTSLLLCIDLTFRKAMVRLTVSPRSLDSSLQPGDWRNAGRCCPPMTSVARSGRFTSGTWRPWRRQRADHESPPLRRFVRTSASTALSCATWTTASTRI